MELLAYIMHRRSPEGFLDSLAPMSARDQVLLNNWTVAQKNKKSGQNEGPRDSEMDAFNSMLSSESA